MWYIYHGMIFSLKKKPILPFVTMWMILEGTTPSEISQRNKLYNFTYIWNLKTQNSKKQSRREVSRGWKVEGKEKI